MFHEVNGLPAHVLLVHLTIVLVPSAAVLAVAAAWVPAIRRWAGPLVPLLCLAALVMVPITTNAGEWFQDQLPATKSIRKHADLGGQLWPWVTALAVLAVAAWVLDRRASADRAPEQPTPAVGSAGVRLVVAVLLTVAAVGTVVQVVRVGESGARAVWGTETSSS